MAMEVQAGSFTISGGGTVNIPTPKISGTPKLVIWHSMNLTSAAISNGTQHLLSGVWDPSAAGTNHCVTGAKGDFFGNLESQTEIQFSVSYVTGTNIGFIYQIQVASAAPGSVTFLHASAPPGTQVSYLILGGDDFEAQARLATIGSGPGIEDIIPALGAQPFPFTPDACLMWGNGSFGIFTPIDWDVCHGMWAEGSGQYVVNSTAGFDGSNPASPTSRVEQGIYRSQAFGIPSLARVVQGIPGGIRIDKLSGFVFIEEVILIGFKGGQYLCGDFDVNGGSMEGQIFPNVGLFAQAMVTYAQTVPHIGYGVDSPAGGVAWGLQDMTEQTAPDRGSSGQAALEEGTGSPVTGNGFHELVYNFGIVDSQNPTERISGDFFQPRQTTGLGATYNTNTLTNTYKVPFLLMGNPIPPLTFNENRFVGRISGVVAYENNDVRHFAAHIEDDGSVSVNATDESANSIFTVNNSYNWIFDVLARISQTLGLNPTGVANQVRDMTMEISGRVARPDNTFDDFCVQFVDGEVKVPTSSGPLSTYQEAASLSVVLWLEGAADQGNVTY